MPEHVKEKIRNTMRGRHCSPETEFKKGIVPWNKGLKRNGLRYAYHTTSRTKFKKGYRPLTWKPVGTITIRARRGSSKARVRFIKVAEPNVWIQYSRYIWERTRGRKIPRGFVIYHQDGDSLNDDPENLVCISRAIHIKFQEIDIPGFRSKRLAATAVALKKRWEEHRKANGICVV